MKAKFGFGDVFEVSLGNGRIGYFQYVAKDETMLTSAVIRAFQGNFDLRSPPMIDAVVASKVAFHAHVFLKAGLTLEIWRKVGTAPAPSAVDVLFRESSDYGNPAIKISHNWYVWRINEPMQAVGPLPAQLQTAEIGVVKAPQDIATRIRTGSYGGVYPGY